MKIADKVKNILQNTETQSNNINVVVTNYIYSDEFINEFNTTKENYNIIKSFDGFYLCDSVGQLLKTNIFGLLCDNGFIVNKINFSFDKGCLILELNVSLK